MGSVAVVRAGLGAAWSICVSLLEGRRKWKAKRREASERRVPGGNRRGNPAPFGTCRGTSPGTPERRRPPPSGDQAREGTPSARQRSLSTGSKWAPTPPGISITNRSSAVVERARLLGFAEERRKAIRHWKTSSDKEETSMPRSRTTASSPWKSLHRMAGTASRRGRPRRAPATASRGCAWPVGVGTCGRAVFPGLAVCLHHSAVLDQLPGKECAWPSCPQSGFRPLCTYHDKLVHGLLTPLR